MKYWNWAFNAQGSRRIKIAVDVGGVVKIYVAAMEALRKKEREGETQFTIKIDGFLSFTSPPPPPLSSSNVNVLVCRFFWKFILCTTQLRVLMLCFPYFTDNSFVRILWQCKMMARKYSAWQGTSRYKGKANCPFFLVSFCCCYCHFLSLVVVSMGAFERGAGTRVNQHLL
jgi:hypothetical protein